MATPEELRLKEKMWEQEMLFLKNKYNQLEEKVNKTSKICMGWKRVIFYPLVISLF